MPTPADGYAGDVTPTEAWEMVRAGARLVNVRTAAEWGYVGVPDLSDLAQQVLTIEWVSFPGGVANPDFIAQLQDGLAGTDPATPVVFLCRSGVRSVGAAKAATAAGFAHSYNILDGFEGGLDEAGHRGATGWRAEGLPWRQS